jgi:hypothetical protein
MGIPKLDLLSILHLITSLTTGRHTVGGAPPPDMFLAQSQDNPEEWFLLGLTSALVVRKCRGLSRQIWRAYQDRSINALVYHPLRTTSSRLKVYTRIKLHDATPRIEGSIKLLERKQRLQANKSYSRTLDSSGPQSRAENLLTLVGTLDSMTPANLTGISMRFRQDTFGNINSSAVNFSKWSRSIPPAKASPWCNSDYHRWVGRATVAAEL